MKIKGRYWIFMGLHAAMGIYEIYALTNKEEGDSVSEIIWNATRGYPLVPFGIGVLMGHFFWQQPSKPKTS